MSSEILSKQRLLSRVLLELGEKYGVFERKGNRIVVGDSSVYPSTILKDPEKYFTEEIMEKLDWAAGQEYKYGS